MRVSFSRVVWSVAIGFSFRLSLTAVAQAQMMTRAGSPSASTPALARGMSGQVMPTSSSAGNVIGALVSPSIGGGKFFQSCPVRPGQPLRVPFFDALWRRRWRPEFVLSVRIAVLRLRRKPGRRVYARHRGHRDRPGKVDAELAASQPHEGAGPAIHGSTRSASRSMSITTSGRTPPRLSRTGRLTKISSSSEASTILRNRRSSRAKP